MTTYIQIPQTEITFATRYLELTGETVQTTPLENMAQTHYLVGSSRVTQEQITTLEIEFPDIITTNEFPSLWVTKIDA